MFIVVMTLESVAELKSFRRKRRECGQCLESGRRLAKTAMGAYLNTGIRTAQGADSVEMAARRNTVY